MKTIRLPETDLARIAPLGYDEKVYRLERHGLFRPRLSYQPLRAIQPEVFNLQMGALECAETPWNIIEQLVRRSCRRRPDWLDDNLLLAQLEHNYAQSQGIMAYQRVVLPISTGFGFRAEYWSNFYFVDGDRPAMCFIDPRRGNGLDYLGRKFAFSMMHQACAIGDFADLLFKVIQFPVGRAGQRSIKVWDHDSSDLFSLDQLNKMIQETYELWIEVQMRRATAARKQGRG